MLLRVVVRKVYRIVVGKLEQGDSFGDMRLFGRIVLKFLECGCGLN
jgi:hypothetical protein